MRGYVVDITESFLLKKGALYLNCAAVGAFFHPMKRAGRKTHGTIVKLKVKGRPCKTTQELLEHADVSGLESGQSDMSTEECIIEEVLIPADLAEDGTKQVRLLIVFACRNWK